MRVLVCDDDPAARFVAKRWLTSAFGCTVTESEDGVQALDVLSTQPFDLALIDLDLPRLNGVEVVEAIRGSEATHDLPIVILSQERREDVVRTLLTLGVSAYLLKPLRERTVLGRIGPLLATRRANRVVSARPLNEIRIGPDSPAMLVDGDQNFLHVFSAVAGDYGPVMPAASGAAALALFRRSPASLVFIGTGLGIVSAEALVKKIREVESGHTRLIGVGVAADSPLAAQLDGLIPRTFVTEALQEDLRPFVRIRGPFPALDELAPQFAGCLTSAVTQVFGMMGGLDASHVADGAPDAGPSLVAQVTVDVHQTHQLDLELVLPRAVAEEVSIRLLGCDRASLDDEGCLATVGELGNMVSGRLDAWLKGRSLTSHCTLPEMRAIPDGAACEPIGPADGFSSRFRLAELDHHVALRARVRQAVDA
jgi:CheY-like chemotaxis protein